MTVPVLVDFWRLVRPLQVAGPGAGSSKWNTRAASSWPRSTLTSSSNWRAMFGIRSIPTCVLLKNGQPVDGFMAHSPRARCGPSRQSMCPAKGALEAEADGRAHELLESGDTQAALSKMADAPAADPTNDDACFDYVRLLIATGGYEEADALLQEPRAFPQPLRFDALWRWLDALQFVQNDDRGNWPLEHLTP